MSFKCNIGLHPWDGCKCSDCGKIRDAEHDVAADCGKCSRCGTTFNDDAHDWSQDCDKCHLNKTLQCCKLKLAGDL